MSEMTSPARLQEVLHMDYVCGERSIRDHTGEGSWRQAREAARAPALSAARKSYQTPSMSAVSTRGNMEANASFEE